LGELENRLDELSKEEDIFVVCRTGNRSDLAAQKLAEKGFTKVINVVPGMSQWSGKTTSFLK
jgi:rhodanese-related sulfurtransferase